MPDIDRNGTYHCKAIDIFPTRVGKANMAVVKIKFETTGEDGNEAGMHCEGTLWFSCKDAAKLDAVKERSFQTLEMLGGSAKNLAGCIDGCADVVVEESGGYYNVKWINRPQSRISNEEFFNEVGGESSESPETQKPTPPQSENPKTAADDDDDLPF